MALILHLPFYLNISIISSYFLKHGGLDFYSMALSSGCSIRALQYAKSIPPVTILGPCRNMSFEFCPRIVSYLSRLITLLHVPLVLPTSPIPLFPNNLTDVSKNA